MVACGPGAAGEQLTGAVDALWAAAARRAAQDAPAELEHLLVPIPGGAVAVVQAHGHRAVAVTGERPAAGLLLFDLRTCLADAFAACVAAS